MIRLSVIALMGLIMCSKAFGQRFDLPIDSLAPAAPFSEAEEDLLVYHPYYFDNWRVYEDARGLVRVANFEDTSFIPFPYPSPFFPYGYNAFIKVHNGYLVACYSGEFLYGGLYWVSDSTHRQRIPFEGPWHLLIWNDQPLGIGGLKHMGTNSGYMSRYKFRDTGWYVADRIEVDGMAYLSRAWNMKNLVLVTDSSLSLLDIDLHRTLLMHSFWHNRFPNSLLIKNNVAYIGMRGGVYKYHLINHKGTWLESRAPAKIYLHENFGSTKDPEMKWEIIPRRDHSAVLPLPRYASVGYAEDCCDNFYFEVIETTRDGHQGPVDGETCHPILPPRRKSTPPMDTLSSSPISYACRLDDDYPLYPGSVYRVRVTWRAGATNPFGDISSDWVELDLRKPEDK